MTIADIGRPTGAETVVWKLVRVGTWRQTSESDDTEIETRILSPFETSLTRVADALTEAQALEVSTVPEIVCIPFLNESRKETDGTFSVSVKRA